MSTNAPHHHRNRGVALLLASVAACGNPVAADPNNREVAWTYGPMTGGASAEHAKGAGEKGSPIATGWRLRLHDGKRLTVKPYQLAETHPLFGRVAMSVGLYDQDGKEIAMLRSDVLTAQNASFAFDLEEGVAARLWDAVLWFVKA